MRAMFSTHNGPWFERAVSVLLHQQLDNCLSRFGIPRLPFNQTESSLNQKYIMPHFWICQKIRSNKQIKIRICLNEKPFVLKIRLYSPLLHLHLFSSLDTVDRGYFKILQMTWFEPRISGVGSDRYTNWATTTARETICHNYVLLGSFWKQSSLHIIDSIGSSNREHSF